jgi:Ni,Fe-hydrogenase III large subunit
MANEDAKTVLRWRRSMWTSGKEVEQLASISSARRVLYRRHYHNGHMTLRLMCSCLVAGPTLRAAS